MLFSRDVRDMRYWTARSMQTSRLGPYSRLDVPKRYNLRGWCWAIGYGVVIGAMLYLVVAVRAGA